MDESSQCLVGGLSRCFVCESLAHACLLLITHICLLFAGVTAGNDDFQSAIRRAVPDGHTFKGYPVQFVHRNARRAFAACIK